ncbi:Membrane protease subunit, stomatin/prohibitin family, contains C-terminal Zn-ribbon domain [Ruminococcaceae bacterium KH2T8]|nr:Membrane protease subunit, stomatin/prohibitin family, contains C-terminal Zn-ribbon domain [Ruminococcaceae bacterium KH2T8]
MGLISIVKGVVGGAIGVAGASIDSQIRDQIREVFTCDSLGQNVLVRRGAVRRTADGKNKGNEEIISSGSIIMVPENTALLLVDGGQIVDFTTEAGYYRWDSSTSPSMITATSWAEFKERVGKTVADTWERMTAGGTLTKQQRVYFVNMLPIRDNKFGSSSPISYADPEYRQIYIRLNGMFSYQIVDPVTFFRCVSGNIAGEYLAADFMGTVTEPKQPRIEFCDHIAEVLNRCGGQDKIMFANLPSEQTRLRTYMQECLDEDWLKLRGVVVETVAIGGITPDEKSRARIEEVDNAKLYASDPNALAAQVALGQTEAMKAAGANSAGAATGLMGLGMMGGVAGANGGTAAAFNFLGQQQQAQQAAPAAAPVAAAPAADSWSCECGAVNTGNFCAQCGKAKPAPAGSWTCECGAVNTGKFCPQCGKAAPEAAPAKCPKCGYTPADGVMPKFCPECGTKIE